jgi:hypothetical protein
MHCKFKQIYTTIKQMSTMLSKVDLTVDFSKRNPTTVDFSKIIIVTQGWVVNSVRRHAEPLGDNDPPQLPQK